MRKETYDLLRKYDFTPEIKGFAYLGEAIEMCCKNMSLINNLTKGLYIDIAKKYETTPSRTERAIRHLIDRSCASKKGILFSAFSNKKPKNGQVISLLTYELRFQEEGDEIEVNN